MFKRASAVVLAAAVMAPSAVLAQGRTDREGAKAPADVDVTARAPDAATPIISDVEPALSFEGGAGVLGYIGGTAGVGPAWNVRVTANVSRRLAVEGNYVGGANQRAVVDTPLVMTALDGSVRYNILRGTEAPVQPFVTAGIGYAAFIGQGGDGMALTLPVGGGIERMLTENVKIGARFHYRPALFDNLGVAGPTGDEPGGDTWSVLAHLGGAF